MSILPYIHFPGTCREAIAAYAGIFGATTEAMTYADMPGASEEMKASDRLMHAWVKGPLGEFGASDFPPGTEDGPQQAVTLTVTLPNVNEARRIYDALAEGGAVIQPFGPSFFTDGFGMLKDRFGTHWMVMTPATGA